MSALDIERERAEFEAWWEAEGQYGRAGGGEYEKTFAYNAWMHKAKRADQPAVAGGDIVGLARRLTEHYRDTLRTMFCGDEPTGRKLIDAIAAHVSGQGGEDARRAGATYRGTFGKTFDAAIAAKESSSGSG